MINHRKVAIVILNWNGTKLLNTYLPTIIQHSPDPDVSVVVADNASTDDSVMQLKQNFPSVQIISLAENFGFAKGYNKALEDIKADYFAIVNSDVEVTENWIEPCIRRMEENNRIAVVQPKILDYISRGSFEYAGAAGGFIDKYGYPFCRGRILNVTETDDGQYDEATPVFWASGACMFVNARLFREVGGFDPDFWAHMEEIDLCWRLKNRGFQIWYEPRSVVYHLGGGTLSYDNPLKIYLNFRNNLLMLLKNLPRKKIVFLLPFRIILDYIAAFKFLLGLNGKALAAIFKAHGYFCARFLKFRKKRRSLLQYVTNDNHPEIYPHGIMLRFFILKKRIFSELNFQFFRQPD